MVFPCGRAGSDYGRYTETTPSQSGQFHATLAILCQVGSQDSRTGCSVTSCTTPPIRSTSGVDIRCLLTLWGRNAFLAILSPCWRGFVMRNLHLVFQIESYCSAGHKDSGGSRDPTSLLLGIRGRPTKTCFPASCQIYGVSGCPRVAGRRER